MISVEEAKEKIQERRPGIALKELNACFAIRNQSGWWSFWDDFGLFAEVRECRVRIRLVGNNRPLFASWRKTS